MKKLCIFAPAYAKASAGRPARFIKTGVLVEARKKKKGINRVGAGKQLKSILEESRKTG